MIKIIISSCVFTIIMVLIYKYFYIFLPLKKLMIKDINEDLKKFDINLINDIKYIKNINCEIKNINFFKKKRYICFNVYIDKKLYILDKLQNKNDITLIKSHIKIFINRHFVYMNFDFDDIKYIFE